MIRAWVGLLALVAGCQACSGQQQSPAVVAGVDLAVCVLTQYAADVSCRSSSTWATCTTDIAAKCGSDVASVVSLLAAHKRAMVADGFVPASPTLGDAGP